MGNIFARPRGFATRTSRPVVTGSHLDSQPTGGKYDGAYGVLAGLEVIRCPERRRSRKRDAPVEVVCVDRTKRGPGSPPAMVGSRRVLAARCYDLDYGLTAAPTSTASAVGPGAGRDIGYEGDADPAATTRSARLFRGAYRAGAAAGSQRMRHRRGAGAARPALVRRHDHGAWNRTPARPPCRGGATRCAAPLGSLPPCSKPP